MTMKRIKTGFRSIQIMMLVLCMLFCGCANSSGASYVMTFNWPKDGETKIDIYYSDDYFREPGGVYNPSLATLSFTLALASKCYYPSKGDYSIMYKDAETYLHGIGFEEVTWNEDYQKKNGLDTAGFVVGKRTIEVDGEDVTLIAATTKSFTYSLEWLSNFNVGLFDEVPGHHHAGFYSGAVRFYDFLQKYIDDQGITGKAKLWISGFSRGGCISNMCAGMVDQHIEETGSGFEGVELGFEDLYAYHFEPPQGVYEEEGSTGIDDPHSSYYSNIFCVMDENDPVPLVTPIHFGFTRYGTDYYYPGYLNDANCASSMEDMYRFYVSYYLTYDYDTYYVDKFKPVYYTRHDAEYEVQYAHPSAGYFLRNLFDAAAKNAWNREIFEEQYHKPIAALVEYLFDDTDFEGDTYAGLADFALYLAKDNNYMILMEDILHDPDHFAEDFSSLLMFYVYTSKSITETGKELLENANDLASLIINITKDDPSILLTLVGSGNINGLFGSHYPLATLAWLQAMDPNYMKNRPIKASLNDGKFYRVTITNTISFDITDSSANTVALSWDHEIIDLVDSNIYCTRKSNGTVVVLLPVNGTYTYNLYDVENIPGVSVEIYDPQTNIYTPVQISTSRKGVIGK